MKKRVIVAAYIGLALGCFSCVARGTRVWTPGGWRAIETLEVGDSIYSVDELTGELFETTVVAIRSATREVGSIEIGDRTLRLTSDHPVYCPTARSYEPAGDWLLGERTTLSIAVDGGIALEAATRVSTFVGVDEVFDITVEHPLHNFIAEGVVVHNKSPALENNELYNSCACPGGGEGTYHYSEDKCDCSTDAGMDSATDDGGGEGDETDASADLGTGDGDTSITDDTGSELDAAQSRRRGTCADSSDCADPTWACIPLGAEGTDAYHACQPPAAAEPGCETIEAPDSCCVHTDCADDPSGTCVIGPIFYCGGAQPQFANVCVYDECTADGDCGADEFCLPARVLAEPVARCAFAECRLDSDCSSRSGGQCEAFFDPCNGRLSGFHCTYDDSECRTNDDCPGPDDDVDEKFCSPGTDGMTQCIAFMPPP